MLCTDGDTVRVWRGDRLPQPLRDALRVDAARELLFAIAYDDMRAYSTAKWLANAIGGGDTEYTSVPSLRRLHETDTGSGPCVCPGSFVLVYRRERP
jgi:hypothetical protein